MDGISVLKLDETTQTEVVAQTAEVLLAGGIVIFPTDTVYGLMIHGTDAEQLARLNALKRRISGKPIPALAVADAPLVAHMRELVRSLGESAVERLIPGALTVVTDRSTWGEVLPRPLASLPYNRIGVRVPDYPALQEILSRCGGWLMATSANPEGHPTPSLLAGVIAQLGETTDIGLAVDGGECGAEPSAVMEVIGGRVRTVRSNPLLGS